MKPKLYVLNMFRYPSGKGLYARHPIGWDTFGLATEQYAIETNNHPKKFKWI